MSPPLEILPSQPNHRTIPAEYDTITVGECPWTHSPSDLSPYVLPSSHELQMVFTFHHVSIDSSPDQPLIPRPWALTSLKSVYNTWQTHMHSVGGWIPVYIENHDQARSVSRFADGRAGAAKMLAVLMACAQSGTVYVYQGQEIGMRNVPHEWGIEEYKDVASQLFWDQSVFGFILFFVLTALELIARLFSRITQDPRRSSDLATHAEPRHVRHPSRLTTQSPRQRPYSRAMERQHPQRRILLVFQAVDAHQPRL